MSKPRQEVKPKHGGLYVDGVRVKPDDEKKQKPVKEIKQDKPAK